MIQAGRHPGAQEKFAVAGHQDWPAIIHLARAGAGQDLWPGDGLHTPLRQSLRHWSA